MTDTDDKDKDDDGDEVVFQSVLRQPLAREHYELLYLLWKPIEQAEMLACTADWPWWDFVERELYRTMPHWAMPST